MYQTGLLLLTGPIRLVHESITYYLKYASKNVGKCLYIKLEPEFSKPFSKSDVVNLPRLSNAVPFVYNNASVLCKDLDVRILLSSFDPSVRKNLVRRNFDVILTNSKDNDENISFYINNQFDHDCCNIIKIYTNEANEDFCESLPNFNAYDTVCLGGTFDHLHNGHKVLLSEAALRATKKLIVGVTDISMLKKKVLWELIQPVEKRIDDVSSFLCDIDQSLQYEVVPILDPYGPTITNPDIDCIVVSEETKLGGEKVNIERKKKNMKELSMHIVKIMENFNKNPGEDEKLSSSTERMNLLGTLLKQSEVIYDNKKPYCILLRGLPMCGKSCIANSFKALGVTVVCCNEIISSILLQDFDLKEKIVQSLKTESIFRGDSVDFKSIMTICLNDEQKRELVSSLIFDKVKSSVKQKLMNITKSDASIIILKDSSLLCGKLKDGFNEIWTAILPVSEVEPT